MHTHSIAQERWKKMFDSLSRIYDGSTASLEILSPELGDQFEVEEQPFRGITYDGSGIELVFVIREGRHLAHRIPHPKKVMLEEGDEGLMEALAIESDDDHPPVVVRFHAPVGWKLLPKEAGESLHSEAPAKA
jgi:hypothetical protein